MVTRIKRGFFVFVILCKKNQLNNSVYSEIDKVLHNQDLPPCFHHADDFHNSYGRQTN